MKSGIWWLTSRTSSAESTVSSYMWGRSDHSEVLEFLNHILNEVQLQYWFLAGLSCLGRMYVEGESDKEGCVQGTKGPSDNPKFEIPIGACNMRRQRTLHPRGISFSFTLITSFHPVGFINFEKNRVKLKFFVTGMDRAFSVRCFFLESVRSLNAAVDIGQLTTQIVEQEFPLPICNYQLKEGNEGVALRFAQVGQKVTHVWHCDQG